MTAGIPGSALDLRPAGLADLELLAALHARCFGDGAALGDPWDARAMADIMGMPGSLGFLAIHGPAPCGLVIIRVTADEAELLTIGVDPAHRGHGIGAALLARAQSAAGSRGARQMYLEVADCNATALALYAKAGFEDCGFRRGYYAAGTAPRAVSAVVMACALEDSPDIGGDPSLFEKKAQ